MAIPPIKGSARGTKLRLKTPATVSPKSNFGMMVNDTKKVAVAKKTSKNKKV